MLAGEQGRVTLTSNVAVTVADVVAIKAFLTAGVYPIFNGDSWVACDLAEQTLELDAGHHLAGKNFPIFAALVSGVAYFGTGPAWTSDTVRGSSGGDVEHLNGRRVNKSAMSLRASGGTVTVPAHQALLVGDFRAVADGQAVDSAAKRLLRNEYNQVPRAGAVVDTEPKWPYAAAVFRQAHNNPANQVEMLLEADTLVTAEAASVVVNEAYETVADFRTVLSGIGIDSSTVNSAHSRFASCSRLMAVTALSKYEGYPGAGYHTIRWLERGNGADLQQWFGQSPNWTSGLTLTAIM